MELNWDLKEIYKSFKSDEFKKDMEKLIENINNFNLWAQEIGKDDENIVRKLEEYIKSVSRIEELKSRLGMFVELSLSVNTKDEVALKFSDVLDKNLTYLVEASTKVERWISKIKDIDIIINGSKELKEHEFILNEIIRNSKYLLSEKEELILSNMQNTGSKAWLRMKDTLISNLTVEVEKDGEIKSLLLTEVLNMAYDKDRSVRKNAYEAEIKSYKKVEESLAAALNGIKGEVLTSCELRGYKSPLEMTLFESRMDEKTLNVMISAMEESMPVFRKYLRKKGEMLGHKNGLPFYDLYAPVSDAEMKFTYEEGTKFVEDNFRTFSDNLANFARKAIDNSWIDVMPKAGKVGGAFCENLHFIGQSRFLLNYGDNFSDVITLAHELGHGFHGDCLNNETTLNSDYPMPIAETASTFCETIIKNAALKNASKEESLAILETEISDCTQVIVDIYSRFLFEKWFFEKRNESALSVEEIKDLMIKSQKEAYGDGLDPEYLHPYMWTWKPHYYYAESNFYNFPYAFGLLFAKGLYAEYLKTGKAFSKDYEKLLSMTGKNNLIDITKVMGIDINSKDFWRSSLRVIEKDIEKFINI
ncbi:M3 family oligoendopeptidase [Clostridium vincentii]|uniref:Oligoendopeptidase F n=1 Tax=Clostridium vincentii TaxID=52704 RepID=A0A2T0BJM9_9CLOT|nr:M3 family oligoendopeptidase [Clostridium vincentii]PRR84057.1 Oligoendopeptidase F [Clostridium vincentii]